MKVTLAGFNVDADILKELEQKAGKREDLTPEVLSAAYARISRDPRTITEIRQDARHEVEKSRKSNSAIIFKMGHHSVAEHAVFNWDILGVTRFAMEEVEKFRLCSYTEKSQRYITLQDDFVIPKEIKGTKFEDSFTAMIREQNKAYFELFSKLKEHVFKKYADIAADPKKHNLLEGWAKEDARYITSLATESQVGLTLNARNFELMLRRFASSSLSEINDLGRKLHEQVVDIAPSIVIFHEANDLDRNTLPELKKLAKKLVGNVVSSKSKKEVELVEYTIEADNIIAASLLHSSSDIAYEQCKDIAQKMSLEDKKNIFKTTWQNMQLYDSLIREFEYANLTFNIILSSACFGQLKRHRMSTITSQNYDPSLGVTIPKAIKEIGMDGYFMEIVDKTNSVYDAINKEIPIAAPYILTNAHRKRVLIRVNVRELYHISRLREDEHAQWDIRNVSQAMAQEAKKVMPGVCELIGGKDRYNENFKAIFGHFPKVKDVALPGARKIK
ncbi:MAG: FAD-dependent thymidylate synthase [Candidatus Omnitrophica bacterium]|nr:FAD-dependent thymidylate synthase [Candidatus Omnitrophota bacterium]